MSSTQLHRRACHLCEAICGVLIETENNQVVSIRGDEEDPLSRGHICPKAMGLKDIQEDPDRLRKPMKRVGQEWIEIDWPEAIELACEGLWQVQQRHGQSAVGVYQGNPNVHNWGLMTHASNFLGMLKTRNRFSATSIDQLPQQLVSYWMYGHQLLITIPDIDHTQHWLILGGNPLASNGSLMTVPDVKKRIKALQGRGGRLVVIDPRRTETAEVADSHHHIKPGTDALLVFALINTLKARGLFKLERLEPMVEGLDEALATFAHVDANLAAQHCGIEANVIEQMALDFAAAPSAVAYGRMGACTQPQGTLTQWAIQLLNLVTGNLDQVGGSLVVQPAVDLLTAPGSKPGSYGRWTSRVSQRPEVLGEFPCSIMAEEMLTPGEGQIRAMVTVAGNPVLSTPNGRQMDEALAGLEFMVSVDLYLNETTRHAHVILPTTAPLEHDHYDLIFNLFAVRNTAKYSAAVLPKPADSLDDWELFDRLAACYAQKSGVAAKPAFPPQMVLDMGLQMGVYGMASMHKLSLQALKAKPEGVDLGPLKPSFPQRLMTPNKTIQAAPPPVVMACKQYLGRLDVQHAVSMTYPLQLIGRRHVRSNNSWMHNFERFVKGKNRCTVMIHPNDAAKLGIEDEQKVRIESRVGGVEAVAECSDAVMPGVVSLPHGWGHNRSGLRMQVASQHAGVSANDLTDDTLLDDISGNAAINGVPVRVLPL